MSAPANIRPEVLQDITGDKPDIIAHILQHFLATADSCLIRLQKSPPEEIISKIRHELKGAALSIGADAVANICEYNDHRFTLLLPNAVQAFKTDLWVRNALQK